MSRFTNNLKLLSAFQQGGGGGGLVGAVPACTAWMRPHRTALSSRVARRAGGAAGSGSGVFGRFRGFFHRGLKPGAGAASAGFGARAASCLRNATRCVLRCRICNRSSSKRFSAKRRGRVRQNLGTPLRSISRTRFAARAARRCAQLREEACRCCCDASTMPATTCCSWPRVPSSVVTFTYISQGRHPLLATERVGRDNPKARS